MSARRSSSFAGALVCLCAAASAAAQDDLPWFTGPLLVPGAEMIGAGNILAQPFLSVGEAPGASAPGSSGLGSAEQTTVNPTLYFGYGFTDEFEVQLDLQSLWRFEDGSSSGGIGDTYLELHYLFCADDAGGWKPNARIDYVQTFPTGHFDELDPNVLGVDLRGSGYFASSVVLNATKTFHLGGEHYLRPDVSASFTFPLDTDVRAVNAYGGAMDTIGTVDPGNLFTGYISGEYSLTRHWALALDTTYSYTNASAFRGNPGTNPDGTAAQVGVSWSYQITIAPQIEYDFNDSQGIVLGPWFSVAQENTPGFVNFLVSYVAEFSAPW